VRFGSTEAACTSCREIYPAGDLDRYLWCPDCRDKLRQSGIGWGRLVGLVAATGLALYLYVRVSPSPRFILVYLLLLAMTYSLTSRIAMAVVQGFYRSRGSYAGGSDTQEGE
jgi:hypothetical protein